MARGQGGGGSVAGGAAARTAAQRLAGIVAGVGTLGLVETLRREGLGDFVGRPLVEILAAILEHVAGAASTIDEVDARAALARLQDELFAEAEDAAAVETILTQQAPELEALLSRYFGLYLFEVFCRVFYERLLKVVGDLQASAFLKEIEEYISAALAHRTVNRDVSSIDWAGEEGRQLSADIMEDTLNVFSKGI